MNKSPVTTAHYRSTSMYKWWSKSNLTNAFKLLLMLSDDENRNSTVVADDD